MVGVGGRQLFSKLEGTGPPTQSIYLPLLYPDVTRRGHSPSGPPKLEGLCVYQRL
jgi:hypothetical protein